MPGRFPERIYLLVVLEGNDQPPEALTLLILTMEIRPYANGRASSYRSDGEHGQRVANARFS
jgi:hypothetical protein